jgi:multidrug efflux system outer membrane protein
MWSIAGVATTPIFQGGAIYYGWEQAKAQWGQTALDYESTVLEALRDVSDALTAREKLAAVRQARVRAVDALNESVRISTIRYTDGKASYYEVLNAQQDLFPAEADLARTERDQQIAIVQIYRALGGGWSQYNTPQAQPAPAAP